MATTLRETIQEANEKLGGVPEAEESETREGRETSETQEESKATETSEEAEETTDSNEEVSEDGKSKETDLTDIQLAQAKSLFRALQDPSQAPDVIDFIARKAGYTRAPESKVEARKEAVDIIEQLKSAAGPELDFLIDKIGPVIKGALVKQADEFKAQIQESETQRLNERLVSESEKALSTVALKYLGKATFPDSVMKEMNSIMSKISPNANMKPTEFIDFLYNSACTKLNISPKGGKTQGSTSPNPISQLNSQKGSKTREVPDAPKQMTLKQAIAKAQEQLERG
jgi:hypothetical protein